MNTFFGHFQLAALRDLDSFLRFVAGSFVNVLDLLDNFIAFENLTENDVLPIEPAARVSHVYETIREQDYLVMAVVMKN